MKIEKKINEITQYFKDRIIAGDYEITDVRTFTTQVNIDGFDLDLWTGGFPESNFEIYLTQPGFISNSFKFTDDERAQAWELFEPRLKKFNHEFTRVKKLAQLKELQSEIDKL